MDFGIKNRAMMVWNIVKRERIAGTNIPNEEISRTHKGEKLKVSESSNQNQKEMK